MIRLRRLRVSKVTHIFWFFLHRYYFQDRFSRFCITIIYCTRTITNLELEAPLLIETSVAISTISANSYRLWS
jgi:hypothetical protein